MIPDIVTLVVKAPNQQIEDQNVECQSSWTVRQLKGHLSEVYPSKPKTEEQKIIYSGQLLDDTTILKDVLRTYDSQSIHTMHLVCTPTRKMPEPPPAPQPGTDGLRQRHVPTTTPAEPNRPETRQNDQNHTVEMQNYLSSFVNNYGRVPPYPPHLGDGYLPVGGDPAALANHMMMMQQAYLQYMQQYANMWQGRMTPAAPAVPPLATEPAPTPAPGAGAAGPGAGVPGPGAAGPGAGAAVPGPGAVGRDDEAGAAPAQDWLDQLYTASRLAILFSLVYLYGSTARLLLVVLLVAAGYLHHIGFFRDLQANPAPAPAQRGPQPAGQPDNQANNNNQPNPPPPAHAPAPGTPAPAPAEPQQSLLAVTWMIFTSFFASLIPEAN